MNVKEMQVEVALWLQKYRYYRPHESLGFLTPQEFFAKNVVSTDRGIDI